MEVVTLFYPPEQAGQVSVTATREDWEDILADLDVSFDFDAAEPGSLRLIESLRQIGITL